MARATRRSAATAPFSQDSNESANNESVPEIETPEPISHTAVVALAALSTCNADNGTTTPAARPRARARNTAPMLEPLFDPTLPEVFDSITISKLGDHVPLLWHTSFSDWLDEYYNRFVASTERGGRADLLHIQATGAAHHKTDAATYERLKKEIKSLLNITHGSGTRVHICIKPYVAGQTYSRMIGYCTKDQGLSHFVMRRKNTSDEEIEAGKDEHTTLKLDFMEGLIAINKSNLFSKAHSFWHNHMGGRDHSLTETLNEAINTGKYMFAASVLMNSSGQMREEAAESYFKIVCGKRCTVHDIENMLYIPTYKGARRDVDGGANWRVYPGDVVAAPPRDADPGPLDDFVAMGDDYVPPRGLPRDVPGNSGVHPVDKPLMERLSDDDDDEAENTRVTTTYDRIRQYIHRSKARGKRTIGHISPPSSDSSEHDSDREFIDDGEAEGA